MVPGSRHETCPSGTCGDHRLALRSGLRFVYPAKPSNWKGREDDLGDEDDGRKKRAVGRDEQRVVPQTKAAKSKVRVIHIIK